MGARHSWGQGAVIQAVEIKGQERVGRDILFSFRA